MGQTSAHKIPLQIITEFKVDSEHTLNPHTLFLFLQVTPIQREEILATLSWLHKYITGDLSSGTSSPIKPFFFFLTYIFCDL